MTDGKYLCVRGPHDGGYFSPGWVLAEGETVLFQWPYSAYDKNFHLPVVRSGVYVRKGDVLVWEARK